MEHRLDAYNKAMGQADPNAPHEDEAPKQSWIQIKAAALAERKVNGAPSQKTTLTKRKKASVHAKKVAEIKVPAAEHAEEANHMDKTEAPSDPEPAVHND